MAATLTIADVERIAALAHLELTEDEKALFTRQLGDILAYAERLREVDTTGISASWHPGAAAPSWRDDEVRPSLPLKDVLANAPDAADTPGLFRVPKVIG